MEQAMTHNKKTRFFCARTRLCKFHLAGKCLRGEDCNFAHSETDLLPTPSFEKTVICKQFANNGTCRAGADCSYAHSKEELRRSFVGKSAESMALIDMQWARAAAAASSASAAASSSAAAQGKNEPHPLAMAALLGNSQQAKTLSGNRPLVGLQQVAAHSKRELLPPQLQRALGMHAAPEAIEDYLKQQSKKTQLCKFFAEGTCARGPSCSFAHTQAEVRPRPDLTKTQFCVQFTTHGKCSFSWACKYAHSADELRSPEAIRSPNVTPSNCTPKLFRDCLLCAMEEEHDTCLTLKNTFLSATPRAQRFKRSWSWSP
eukprot:TRINITY_DN24428_c0_g2_i1.p1 TRINITY_DN24428_c0_g2~~TRINITY_DN24428_c0_g2_i1.p1  ORF type:complete len:316 (+),score=47.68 TRINITY_DN24428_c0_g2_i1:79-1026(+)